MSPTLSLVLVTAFSMFGFNTSSITDCGTNPVFSITSQSFAPAIPVAGDNVSWTITYKVPAVFPIQSAYSINSGTVNGFIPITPTKSDLCGVVECPITEGEYSTTSYQVWPEGVAGYKVALTSQWVDDENNELLCSKVVVTGKDSLLDESPVTTNTTGTTDTTATTAKALSTIRILSTRRRNYLRGGL